MCLVGAMGVGSGGRSCVLAVFFRGMVEDHHKQVAAVTAHQGRLVLMRCQVQAMARVPAVIRPIFAGVAMLNERPHRQLTTDRRLVPK